MSLIEKQHEFCQSLAHFFIWLDAKGYSISLGEGWRPKWVAEHYEATGQGIANSLHCDRLALDLNIFKNGKYLLTVDDLAEIGSYWESMSPEHAWGGRFNPPDVVHFSVSDSGRR